MALLKRMSKRVVLLVLAFIMAFGAASCTTIMAITKEQGQGYLDAEGKWIETEQQKDARMAWWREARFGMFIHWGLYAVTAGEWKGKWQKNKYSEWIQIHFKIPVEEYEKLTDKFNPVKFDAEEWVKLAKDAGMKYIVITSKHHDGFAMFGSKASKFNIVDATDFGRDPMKELAAACQKYGLKLCFYHSQSQDWHEPDAIGNFWDFPDGFEKKPGTKWRKWVRTDFEKYMARKAKPQVRELLTNYGPIGLIWYDTPMTITKSQATEFVNLVRELQPKCLINSRIYARGKDREVMGDYGSTGDNRIPGTRRVGDWEMPGTINDTWGYRRDDHNWKSSKKLIRNLINIASMGGNYLLNIGPKADGTIGQSSVDRLRAIGEWMKVNDESIYGTVNSPFDKLAWGRCTAKSNKLYFHVFDWPTNGKLEVPAIKNKIKKAYLLANKKNLKFAKSDDGKIILDVPEDAIDEAATVIVVEFKGELDL